MRNSPLVFLLFVLACRGSSNDDNDGTDDTIIDTATKPWEGFQPHFFGVTSSAFAVDDSGRASGYTTAGGSPEPIEITIRIADETFDPPNVDFTNANSCTITLVADGPLSEASWSDGVGAWAAYELEVPLNATTFNDCDQKDFPPIWGDPVDIVTAHTWGVGVGALSSAVAEAIRKGFKDPQDWTDIEPYILGGGYYWSGLKDENDPDLDQWNDGYVDTAVTFAYEVDATLVEQTAGKSGILIANDTVELGDGISRGLYKMQGSTLLSPAAILLP